VSLRSESRPRGCSPPSLSPQTGQQQRQQGSGSGISGGGVSSGGRQARRRPSGLQRSASMTANSPEGVQMPTSTKSLIGFVF
jgi:hypothetical protein